MKDKEKRGPAEWRSLNILGVRVSIYRWCDAAERILFNAYAMIPGSRYLNDSAIGDPTFRSEDEVGVDTCQKRNEKQTESERLMSALKEIEGILVKARAILKWDL